MPTAQEMIAHALKAAQGLLHRYIDDLKPEEFHVRPCPGGNDTAWVIGHLARTAYRQLKFMQVPNVPDLPAGFEEKFAATKQPAPGEAETGDPKESLRQFDFYHGLLINAVLALPDDALGDPPPFSTPFFTTLGEALNFLALHVAMHLGQVTVVRRSLGYPPLA